MTDEKYTHIAVIADRSGSMSTIAKDMNGGLEEFLKEQAEFDGTLLVDITTFDGSVETVAKGVKASEVSHPIIVPRGMTALNDAIGITVANLGERFAKLEESQRPGKVIVMVVTDGGENSSSEYTTEKVKELVTRQQDEWKWEFLFLGANIDSFNVAGGYGILRGSTINYEASAAGANSVIATASAYVTRTRSGLEADFTEEERAATMGNLKADTK